MRSGLILPAIAILISLAFTACEKDHESKFRVISSDGNVNSAISQFRAIAGATVNLEPGVTNGRREINWEGVPAELLDQQLPNDFFNQTGPNAVVANQRGLKYTTIGSSRVSAERFASLNPEAANEFEAFSGNKVFANVSSALWDVEFEVAGTTTRAATKSFGLVFVDVDKPNSTFIEVFNDQVSLGKFYAPVHDAGTKFSFIGVGFPEALITRVRIGHEGTIEAGGADISDGGVNDLVVLDDFIYSEPAAR